MGTTDTIDPLHVYTLKRDEDLDYFTFTNINQICPCVYCR